MKAATRLLIAAVLVLVAGCATAPGPFDRAPANSPSLIDARQDQRHVGTQVRWGGRIARVENQAGHSVIEIVDQPLGRRGRPVVSEQSDGRFLARLDGFIDPVIYAPGAEITVVGPIDKTIKGYIGEYPYQFTQVSVAQHKLWPERRQDPFIYSTGPWYYDPFGWHRPQRPFRYNRRHRKVP